MSAAPTSRRKLNPRATRMTARARVIMTAAAARFRRGDSAGKSSGNATRTNDGGGGASAIGRLRLRSSSGTAGATRGGLGSGKLCRAGAGRGSDGGEGGEGKGRRNFGRPEVGYERDESWKEGEGCG